MPRSSTSTAGAPLLTDGALAAPAGAGATAPAWRRWFGRRPGHDGAAVTGAERRWGLMLVLPAIVIFAITRVIPSGWAFYLSFTEYSILQSPEWVGFENYQALFKDPVFVKSVTNTLIYAISTTVLSTGLALALAIGLNQRLRGRKILRTAYFAPVVISIVAVSSIWLYMLNSQYGVVNWVLSLFGVAPQGWLSEPSLALMTMIFVGVWQNLGYGVMIYLAGLQGIPHDLREAAMVDGASGLRYFRRILWPLLRPTTMLVVLLVGVTTIQAFDQVIVLTGGGPGNATTTVVHQVYLSAFEQLRMGYAAAMSFVFFIGVLLLSLLVMRLGRQNFKY